MFAKSRRVVFSPALFCGLALVLAIVVSRPAAEMAMGDDWSYIWSARILANTGHIVYNGWTAAILGWQLYLGAAFIKVFGFSFLAARISVLVVAITTVMLIQRLLVRFGVSEWNATIGTLTIALSPLFLPLAFSFMSDVPGFFCIVLCFYSCIRAIQASTPRAALGWLVFAALSNVAGGTVRQVAWLGVLVMVPSTAWHLRKRPGVPAVTGVLLLVSAIVIAWCMHWFKLQPYAIPDQLVHVPHGTARFLLKNIVVRNCLATCFFVLPVLIGFTVNFPVGNRRARNQAVVVSALFAVATLLSFFLHRRTSLVVPFSDNIVTEKGLISTSGVLGNQPDVLSYDVRMTLSFITFAAVVGLVLFLWNASQLKDHGLEVEPRLSHKAIFTLVAPFTLAYICLLVTRENIFDRYLLPLMLIAIAVLLRFYEEKVGGRLPLLSVLLLLLFAVFGVAGVHDLYARDRALLTATNELAAAGVARTEIRAGFEYDAWTQLESWGYINDSRLRIPSDAYRPQGPREDVPERCQFWFSGYTPAVNARYVLSYDQTSCYTPSQFAPVSYHTWLSPHDLTIFIQKVP